MDTSAKAAAIRAAVRKLGTRGAGPVGASSIVVHGPGGLRIEGLDLSARVRGAG